MPRRKKAETQRPPENFLELSEVLSYVGQVIARGVPGGVWVRAEIASLTDRRHLYLDLVQAGEGGGSRTLEDAFLQLTGDGA